MLTKIKPVEHEEYIVWETTDGKHFYWYRDAEGHQRKIDKAS